MGMIIGMINGVTADHCFANEAYGINFEQRFTMDGNPMVLKGVGLKRVFFMKAFVAGFYLEENIPTDQVFDNVPKRIEVMYFVNIPGDKLSKYTEDLMQKNMSAREYKSLRDRIYIMREYFVDLKPGDRYALTYIPKVGTKFEYNGKLVGIIGGEDFARGLFSTWIGANPMDQKIKSQILGLSADKTKNDLEIAGSD